MESLDLENIEGVGSAIAGKLRSAGITTVAALAVTPPRKIHVSLKKHDFTQI